MKKNTIITVLVVALVALSLVWLLDRTRLSSQSDILKKDIQEIDKRVNAAYQCGDDEIKQAELLAKYLEENERPEQFALLAENLVNLLRKNQNIRHQETKYIESILNIR